MFPSGTYAPTLGALGVWGPRADPPGTQCPGGSSVVAGREQLSQREEEPQKRPRGPCVRPPCSGLPAGPALSGLPELPLRLAQGASAAMAGVGGPAGQEGEGSRGISVHPQTESHQEASRGQLVLPGDGLPWEVG